MVAREGWGLGMGGGPCGVALCVVYADSVICLYCTQHRQSNSRCAYFINHAHLYYIAYRVGRAIRLYPSLRAV